jgi:hypothetical protein
MFQYEIQLLKNPQFYIHSSGNIIYKHTFIDTHYQITITRAIITREKLRDYLHIFLVLQKQNKVHVDKIVNDKGVFYTVKIFN